MPRGPLTRLMAAAGAAALLAAACGADGDDRDDDGDPDAAAPAPEWLHLGRDLANSRATPDHEAVVSPDNVDQLEPAWEIPGINGVTGTPIVDGDRLYVGDWTGHVRALDTGSGEELWATDLDTNYVGGSVALDDERVYVGTFDARTVALDRETGEQLWETPIGDHPTAAIFGSPIRVADLVLVGVASFELITGQVEPSFRGHLVALDPATGEEAWRYWTTAGDETEGPGVSVWSSPAVDEERGHLYIGTGNTYVPPASPRSDALIALDLATGEEVWVHQFTEGDTWTTANPVGPDADVGAPPNLFEVDGTPAVGVGDKAGAYHVLDRESGEEIWSTQMTEGGLQGGVLAGGAVADGTIYVASNKASTTADLVAMDQETGEIRWQVEVGGSVAGPVTWSNGLVFLADDSGHISAFDAGSGDRLWSHEVPVRAAGGVAVVDGTVYAGWGWWLTAPDDDPQGGLIAFRLPDDGGDEGSRDDEAAGDEAQSGPEVYERSCASCHGEHGEGSSGPALVGVEDRLSRDEHLQVVREGRADGRMPAWEDILSPEEIEAVVDYERTALAGID